MRSIENVERFKSQLSNETLANTSVLEETRVPIRDSGHFNLVASRVSLYVNRNALCVSRIVERSLIQILRWRIPSLRRVADSVGYRRSKGPEIEPVRADRDSSKLPHRKRRDSIQLPPANKSIDESRCVV